MNIFYCNHDSLVSPFSNCFLLYIQDNVDMPSTLMGQFMEALNSQTNLDDLNLNIDSFQGGLECNVDEVSFHLNEIICKRHEHYSSLAPQI